MAELHWFAFFAKDWLSSPARLSMTPAQRGAYIDLLAVAWGNGDVEPSLPTDEALLAGLSGLGRDWKRLAPLILAQFDVRDGRYYNAKLSEVWRDGQDRHSLAVTKGRKGGLKSAETRRTKRSPASSPATAQPVADGVAESKPSESERLLVGPTAQTSKSPPLTLAPEAPRSGEPRLMDESGVRGKPERFREAMKAIAPHLLRPA